MTKKPKAPAIIIDFSVKRALEQRAQLKPNQDVILPWWFQRDLSEKRSREANQAFAFVMNWFRLHAPEEVEHVYCEGSDTQNIVINPTHIIHANILNALRDAGFRLITEDEMPKQQKTDIWERIVRGSNFNTRWN